MKSLFPDYFIPAGITCLLFGFVMNRTICLKYQSHFITIEIHDISCNNLLAPEF